MAVRMTMLMASRMTALLALVASSLLLLPAGSAWAQAAPPPAEIPRLPDVPLPEWKAPPPSLTRPLVLGVQPDLKRAERLRLGGLVAASLGLASVLTGGVLEAWAVELDTGLHSPRDGLYHIEVAQQRDRVSLSAISLLSVGGALTVGGFTLYAVGQVRINRWHRRHPRDELPPLSGF